MEFGIDVSTYQGKVDWRKVKEAGVKYAGVRTSISWAYIDPRAEYNLKECLANGIIPLPYWVIHPNEDPKRQVDHFLSTLSKFGLDYKKLFSVVDVELHAGVHQCTYKHYQSVLRGALIYMQQLSGITPIVYSRASFINYYVSGVGRELNPSIPTWYNLYYWWMAQYLTSGAEHAGPPTLPKAMSREKILIHQTTDKGTPIGVQSSALDYNRWQTTAEISFAAFEAKYKSMQISSLPTELTIKDKLLNVQKDLSSLQTSLNEIITELD